MRVAVIGSGLGGLSAACTLAARGYEVDVFEKNPWLGGKAAVLEEQGIHAEVALPGPILAGGLDEATQRFRQAGAVAFGLQQNQRQVPHLGQIATVPELPQGVRRGQPELYLPLDDIHFHA